VKRHDVFRRHSYFLSASNSAPNETLNQSELGAIYRSIDAQLDFSRVEMQISDQVQIWLQDIHEQEAARIIAEMVGDARVVLNVGPSWGRDYFFLTQLGKWVLSADIAPQSHLGNLTLCDITNGLPFANDSFDCVVISEVLEHLIEDGAALAEARRVLRSAGSLIVSVPFYNDEPEFHLRVHSPRTIRRLLQATGFEPIAYVERGGLISFPRLVHGVRRILKPFISPDKFNAYVVYIDRWLARHVSWILRMSRGFGCYVSARKATKTDVRQININEFQH